MLNLAAIAELKARIAGAIEEEATSILHDAQERIPVDSGAARDSGRVATEGATCWVSFGKDDDGTADHAPSNTYIERLHEDAEMRHPHGGQAFFLRTAADEAAAGFAERVARRVGL